MLYQIRADVNPSRVYLKIDDFDTTGAPKISTTVIPAASQPISTIAGYNIWSVDVPFPGRAWNVAVDANGTTFESTYVPDGESFGLGSSTGTVCPS